MTGVQTCALPILRNGSEVRFLTAKNKPGMQTYHRSVLLMCLKAFHEVLGEEKLKRLSVNFSLGGGLFLEPAGDFVVDQALVDQVKAKMREYVDAKIPVMKRNISTDEAVDLFHHYKMYDKERLFHYRRVSRVNVYNLGGFEDYHYGYMVQHTGYLKYFDLVPYQQGVVLLLPDMSDPTHVPVFAPQEKLFQVLKESGYCRSHRPGARQKICDDCRPFLFRKNYIFSPAVDSAAGKRIGASSHCSG